MKIYLDNCIVSGMSRSDLEPTEMEAVRQLEAADERGKSETVTSRETWREQDRTRDTVVRSQLERDRQNIQLVRHDHLMLATRAVYDNQGNLCGNAPMLTEIVDKELLSYLTN
jgi:hypothetical protein